MIVRLALVALTCAGLTAWPAARAPGSMASSTFGTLAVQRHGDSGHMAIRLPGLGGRSWVWQLPPHNPPDFAGWPMIMSEPQADDYRDLLANAPDAKVVPISLARHFVMPDPLVKFRQTPDGFLQAL